MGLIWPFKNNSSAELMDPTATELVLEKRGENSNSKDDPSDCADINEDSDEI